MKASTVKFLIAFIVIQALSTELFAQEQRVTLILYKFKVTFENSKGGTYTSEEDYKVDLLSYELSGEGYKKVKDARKKMWTKPDTQILTNKRLLKKDDRVVIIQYHFKNGSGPIWSSLKLHKFSKSSKDYGISALEITSKEMKSSMISGSYTGYTVLYDKVPYTGLPSERKEMDRKNKAVGIGVRG